jgi:ABC-type methionine transport system ATPase subunit
MNGIHTPDVMIVNEATSASHRKTTKPITSDTQ